MLRVPRLCRRPRGRPGRAGDAQFAPKFNIVYLERDAKTPIHLLITDDQNHRLGYLPDGKFVNEIPGADVENSFAGTDVWNEQEEPGYYVPVGIKFTVTVDGSLLKAPADSEVVMIGPGYDVGLQGLKLAPGQKDTLTFSPDGSQMSYKTTSSESPDIIVGFEDKAADYAFLVKGVDLAGGGVINIGLKLDKGQLSINTTGSQKPGAYGLTMDRITSTSDQTFTHDDDIVLAPGDTAYLDFGKWNGDKATPLALEIDHGSKGTIDETVQLTSK